ncbi:MAG: hypothetical protein KKA32_01240 [Actinobacteria bacterium]|nr:hypothetical protein [Actinomycetota bacterium]
MVSGFGIGIVIAPMTSAVMASAPDDKAGSASGVLSTMRQLGSVLGIAVMGAVLQNRAIAYLEQTVTAKLDAVPLIPAAAKEQIISGVTSAVTNMGEMRAGGTTGEPPEAVRNMLAQAPAEAVAFVTSLFSRDLVMGEFVRAMKTTFFVSMAILLVGALVAQLIQSHVRRPDEASAAADAAGPEGPRADAAVAGGSADAAVVLGDVEVSGAE